MKPGSNIRGEQLEMLIVELDKREIEYEIWDDGTIHYDESVQDEVTQITIEILMKNKADQGMLTLENIGPISDFKLLPLSSAFS